MIHKNLPTLQELKSRRKLLRDMRSDRHRGFAPLEQLALTITRRVGTLGFFIFLALWTLGWLFWNMAAPAPYRFDPFPAFVLWLFISNLIQLLLTPLLLVGQNLQNKSADLRAEADYDINLQSEREIEVILERLEMQEKYITKIIDHLQGRKHK